MRRLNVKLALWLLGITSFSVIGVHFLHAFQLDRNADFLRVQAEQARTDGDYKEAVKQYSQYLKHRDDPQGYSVLADLVVEIANDPDATRQDKLRAYTILQEGIRRHPELDDVRLQLVDYTMKVVGRYPEALEHIQYLVEHGAKGADLELKAAKCHFFNRDEDKALKKLYALVGYDEQAEQFAPGTPPGAEEPEAFELLAAILRKKPDGAKKADAVMAQLVAYNDTAQAHLAHANYLQSTAAGLKPGSDEFKDTFTGAKAELDRAFELDPNNSNVVLAAAVYAMSEKDFPKAQELLDRALKDYPERQEVYLRLHQLKLMQNDVAGAAAQLSLGLKKSGEVNIILERLADLQFQLNDIAAVRETCKLMHARGTFAPELLRFEEARIKYTEGDYLAASREFEAARPAFLRNSNSSYAQQIDILLGHCYELLGQWDRALELYRGILQKYPDLLRPRLGEAVALQRLGRYEEASTSVNLLATNAEKIPPIRPQVLQLLIDDQLQKPEDQRDWSVVEEIAAMLYEDPSRSELDKTLLKVDLLTVQNELAEAQKLLTAACKQYPKESRAWISLARLLMRDNNNAGKLTQLFKLAEEKVGDVAPLRLERMRFIVRQGGEGAPEELKKLEKGLDKSTAAERLSLMMQFGAAYMQLGSYEDAKRCWEYSIEHDPKNGPTRQFLFELAFDNKDEATMHQVVKGLYDSPAFGPQSPYYKYCAAAAKLWPINTRRKANPGPLTAEERTALAEARKLIDDALAIRAEWSVLWRVRGEIEQLDGEVGSIGRAITSYQRALDCSHSGQTTVARRLVQLLYATNRISEANDVLKYVGQAADTSDIWRRTVEDIKFKEGDTESALAMAERDVENEPDSPASHVWYGQFLERAGRFDDAEAAYRKAVAAAPEMPQSWDLLVRRLVASKKTAEATQAVREAAESLTKTPIGLARLYERIADFPHAEVFYKAALDEHPDDVMNIKQIVEFYFNSNQTAKAMPYLDQVIQKTSNSTDKSTLLQLAAARRFKAQIVASPGDYEHIIEASRLIEQNAQAGALSTEDTQAIVLMLAGRPEPESRLKATQLLESLKGRRALQPREQAVLGQLYERSGKWDKGRDLMFNAVGRKTDDLDILFPFAQMLIAHGEYDDATRWVDRLEEILSASKVPVSSATKQTATVLRARLLVKSGQAEEAVRVLENLLPRPLPQNQLRMLADVAKLMEELGLYDAAEKLLTEYVGQDPRGAPSMAAFLGRRGDVDKAFVLLEQARKSAPVTAILPIGLESLRLHPDKASKEKFQLLDSWAKTGTEEESNPQQVKMLLAELYDLEGRSQEAVQIYREMLSDPRIDATQKALVKNNLAFLLAMVKGRPESATEAVKLISEAMRVLGPTADLLDTRAVALLSQGKAQQAISDLTMAVADSPSSSKYFHLAQAQKQANNLDAARESLAKAQQSGVDAGQLGTAEIELYKQLVDALK